MRPFIKHIGTMCTKICRSLRLADFMKGPGFGPKVEDPNRASEIQTVIRTITGDRICGDTNLAVFIY